MGASTAMVFALGCAPADRIDIDAPIAPREPIDVVAREQAWQRAGLQGRVLETEHFRIYTTLDSEGILGVLPQALEAGEGAFRDAFGAALPSAPSSLVVFLVRNADEARSILKSEQASPEDHFFGQGVGFTLSGRVYLRAGDFEDTLTLALHEAWHAYAAQVFQLPLPGWLDEGLAASFEGRIADTTPAAKHRVRPWANQTRYDRLMRMARRDRVRPVEEFLDIDISRAFGSENPDLDALAEYYAQSWGFVMYLQSGAGADIRNHIRDELKRLGGTRPDHGVFVRPFDSSILRRHANELDRQFRRWLREIDNPSDRERISLGLGPVGSGS